MSGETNKASGRIIEILSDIRESVVDTSADVRSAGLVLDQVASAAEVIAQDVEGQRQIAEKIQESAGLAAERGRDINLG